MLITPFYSFGLILLSGTMGTLLLWWQKRPQPQVVLVPARIKK